MATKQRVKVSVALLLERVKAAAAEHEKEQAQRLKKWEVDCEKYRKEQIEYHQAQLKMIQGWSLEELGRHNYRLQMPQLEEDQKVIHLLEMAADDTISVDTESDLGRYL